MGEVGREMVSWTIASRNNRAEKRGVRVFLGGSKNSLVALSIMCWEGIYSMRVHVSLTNGLVGL